MPPRDRVDPIDSDTTRSDPTRPFIIFIFIFIYLIYVFTCRAIDGGPRSFFFHTCKVKRARLRLRLIEAALLFFSLFSKLTVTALVWLQCAGSGSVSVSVAENPSTHVNVRSVTVHQKARSHLLLSGISQRLKYYNWYIVVLINICVYMILRWMAGESGSQTI